MEKIIFEHRLMIVQDKQLTLRGGNMT